MYVKINRFKDGIDFRIHGERIAKGDTEILDRCSADLWMDNLPSFNLKLESLAEAFLFAITKILVLS